jgi:hypothetical protein
VSELVSGVLGKFSYSVPWMFAAAIMTGAGWLLGSPAAGRLKLGSNFASPNVVTGALAFTIVVTAIGFTMAAIARPLYQLLEGYVVWPRPLRKWRLEVHRSKKWKLEDQLVAARRSHDRDASLQATLLAQRLGRYPVDAHHVAPTRLGNALRAFETYGRDRYRLDSQTLWHELHMVTPKALLDEVTGSRVGTDFFVAMTYLMVGYGLAGLVLTLCERASPLHYADIPLMAASGLATSLGPWVCYWMAVSTTSYTATAVQAMVNLGRPKLAAELGLSLPSSIEDERELWRSLCEFVSAKYDSQRGQSLDRYRVPEKETPVFRAPRAERVSTTDPDEVDSPTTPSTTLTSSPSGSSGRHGWDEPIPLPAKVLWCLAVFCSTVFVALQLLLALLRNHWPTA